MTNCTIYWTCTVDNGGTSYLSSTYFHGVNEGISASRIKAILMRCERGGATFIHSPKIGFKLDIPQEELKEMFVSPPSRGLFFPVRISNDIPIWALNRGSSGNIFQVVRVYTSPPLHGYIQGVSA